MLLGFLNLGLQVVEQLLDSLIVRLEGEEGFELEAGLAPVVFGEEKAGEIAVGEGVIGIDAHGVVEVVGGEVEFALFEINQAQIVVGAIVFRIDAKSGLILVGGFGGISLAGQRGSEIEMGNRAG